MAYHENGIKTPLKVNFFKNYAYLKIFLTVLSDIQFTTKTN